MRGTGLIALILGAGILAVVFFGCTMFYTYFFARKGRSIMFRDFYECGFRAVPDSRVKLDIQYSALALIFLIYDMEIIILVPLLVNLSSLTMFSCIFIIIILVLLGLSY